MLVAMLAFALAQGAEAAAPPVYEAVFRPLRKSERSYARLGPVGPFYPQVAADAGRSGEATMSCRVAAGGALEACRPVAEGPLRFNFGVAARVMADRKRIVVDGASVGETVLVRVPFVLGAPASAEP